MVKTALFILAIELILIGWVRSRYASKGRNEIEGRQQPAAGV
jgi:hypothetical protein